ncbi:hypothetical protein ABI59_04330 [Acidobacteria bacterium Mor1]|nr:hypothetical protein ABI59_04330 [Acidobacteria bacterium Mor1]
MSARRLRIDLAYDGTEYCGWQFQPRDRTVQGVLEQALTRLQGDRPARVRGAGRTDSGVHALGQVADVLLDTDETDDRLEHALARLLPGDVRATRVRTVAEDFHARKHARSKSYIYRLDRSRRGDPFRLRFASHLPGALDEARLDAALARLPGRRDWSGFTAAACTVEDRVRTLTEASYVESDRGEGLFRFRADGFLTYMVRNLVGTLVEIARGRMTPEIVDLMLETGDRSLGPPTAEAKGLCLEQVAYPACYDPGANEPSTDGA